MPKLCIVLFLITFTFIAYGDEGTPPWADFYPYKQIYLLTGHPDSKLQLSFKFKVLRNQEIYVGYSQLIMWDLFQKSSPIRDINYNPDIFYRWNFNESAEKWLDFGAFEHESNGKDGRASRSWNRSYVRYHCAFFSAKIWIPYWMDDTTTDLVHYRGLWELEFTLSDFMKTFFSSRNDLILRFYTGGASRLNPLQGGQELTLRLKLNEKNIVPQLVFQLFHGYGENLLDASENRTGIRAGLGF